MLVPVVDQNQKPLQPCKPAMARLLIRKGKATPFYKKGIFAIRLNKVVDNPTTSDIVIGIDPGSKRTGISVCTDKEIVLNIQIDTPHWVKKKMEVRKNYRRARRSRNTPYRTCRYNRKIGGIPPSTKARWQTHLRIIDQLKKILPITDVSFEDIKARTKKNQKRWNKSFSPLEVGKKWFQQEIENRELNLYLFGGYDTKAQRDYRGFKKITNKLSNNWNAHCVDSHCLCEMVIGDIKPDKSMYILNLLRFNRRELHKGFRKGGKRRLYGSTRSLGLNRGTLITHHRWGLTYIGGNHKEMVSLHNLNNGKRICQNTIKEDCKILTKLNWRMAIPPLPEGRGILAKTG